MARPQTHILNLSASDREQLEALVRSRKGEHGLVRRARIILLSADGVAGSHIAEELQLTSATVLHWRKRYLKFGFPGLTDAPRSGRPRSVEDEAIQALVQKTLKEKPKGQAHWSTRSAAQATGISKSHVQRLFSLFGLQPHRSKTFSLSTDAHFVDKVHDIVGLYLSPPENAMVLCVDEKSQVQALERDQPILPLGLGYVEGVTHSYFRHGTTTLFAALDIVTGQVMAQCKKRHRHQEFLAFLEHIEENVPEAMDLHLVLDNYSTHKHPKARAWLAQRPRYHLHFTPTYSSWLNQVERWFGLITQRAIKRGSFQSVKELVRRIDLFVKTYNKGATPFIWTATAESILRKIEQPCQKIS
jgi:putative transposase